MIGTLHLTDLPPMEYRWALDAVMPLFHSSGPPHVICHLPVFRIEIEQRLSGLPLSTHHQNGLWVEPMLNSWQVDLQEFYAMMESGSTLILLSSCPIARWLPERRGWSGVPLGLHLLGLPRLYSKLHKKGFLLLNVYGFHSLVSIWLNYQAHWMDRCGYPDVADRLRFSARLKYLQRGPFAVMNTVVLMLFRKNV
jgi:hypothetical protein